MHNKLTQEYKFQVKIFLKCNCINKTLKQSRNNEKKVDRQSNLIQEAERYNYELFYQISSFDQMKAKKSSRDASNEEELHKICIKVAYKIGFETLLPCIPLFLCNLNFYWLIIHVLKSPLEFQNFPCRKTHRH